jgi:hypothetical protein
VIEKCANTVKAFALIAAFVQIGVIVPVPLALSSLRLHHAQRTTCLGFPEDVIICGVWPAGCQRWPLLVGQVGRIVSSFRV